jgi:hypothetical protein
MASSTLSPDRAAYRAAVAEIAAKATAKLPECRGRVASAVKIVLADDVQLLPAGGARVASRTDATVQYHIVNGHCHCRDYARAPGNLCAPRLAYGIARRATELVPSSPAPPLLPPAPAAPLPEAPASCNVYLTLGGHKVQVTLRDHDERRMLERLQAVLERYPAPATPEPREGWCAIHNVPMRLHPGKNGKPSWWSHRTAEGWCKGK